MNILPGALILALLLLPGFIFRMGYLAKPFASKSFNSSFVEELLFSLLPAFIIQICGYLIVEHFRGVNEQTFLLLLINSEKSILHTFTASEIAMFATYLLVVCGCAIALGFGMRYIALRTRLHLQYSLFRIYNEWQIYFDGFILDYPDEPGERKDVMQKWLDVLVENKNGSYIYSGFLNEYVLAKDDTLSRIYLTAVRRRKLEDDYIELEGMEGEDGEGNNESEVNYDEPDSVANLENTQLDKRYYFMPGDYFMIPGSEIKSINITYYTGELTDIA
jgi:hypothetical protein